MRTKLKLPAHFAFTTEMQVRINDVNYAGHLGNDHILSLIHEARARYLKQFGCTELDVFGTATIMVDAVVVYKSEAFHGDRITVQVTTDAFTKHGCDFIYRLTNKETRKEIARAKTGLVFFDYDKRKMTLVPDEFRILCDPD